MYTTLELRSVAKMFRNVGLRAAGAAAAGAAAAGVPSSSHGQLHNSLRNRDQAHAARGAEGPQLLHERSDSHEARTCAEQAASFSYETV